MNRSFVDSYACIAHLFNELHQVEHLIKLKQINDAQAHEFETIVDAVVGPPIFDFSTIGLPLSVDTEFSNY